MFVLCFLGKKAESQLSAWVFQRYVFTWYIQYGSCCIETTPCHQADCRTTRPVSTRRVPHEKCPHSFFPCQKFFGFLNSFLAVHCFHNTRIAYDNRLSIADRTRRRAPAFTPNNSSLFLSPRGIFSRVALPLPLPSSPAARFVQWRRCCIRSDGIKRREIECQRPWTGGKISREGKEQGIVKLSRRSHLSPPHSPVLEFAKISALHLDYSPHFGPRFGVFFGL